MARARWWVGGAVGVCLLTAVTAYTGRPRVIPAPACADSVQGVVGRLLGVDSVVGVTYRESSAATLGWVRGSEYAYRGGQPDMVAVLAEVRGRTVTFAKGRSSDCGLLKHELVHVMRGGGHPGAVFRLVEEYAGR